MAPVDVGTRGPATGVNPVPPSIRLSKLKIPADGVEMGMPLKSLLRTPANVCDGVKVNGTANELGRFGFIIRPIGPAEVGVLFDADDIRGLLCSRSVSPLLAPPFIIPDPAPDPPPNDEQDEDEVESVLMVAGGVVVVCVS